MKKAGRTIRGTGTTVGSQTACGRREKNSESLSQDNMSAAEFATLLATMVELKMNLQEEEAPQ